MAEYLFKVIVIGEASVGKTSIIHRYVERIFNPKYKYTIGVDFALKVIEWDEDTTVRLQLWDIAGQERFGIMTHVYYKEAAAACVVFDITSPRTFQAAAKWKADVDSKVFLESGDPVPSILLANKSDLDKQCIPDEDIDAFCKEHNFTGWFKTSAKADVNIDSAMRFLIQRIMNTNSAEKVEEKGVDIAKQNQPGNSSCCGH